MDTFSPAQRSAIMRQVRSKDTKPEMVVRRLVHAMGHRYRLHSKNLPGCPDLTFSARGKAIFVHGCFWHRHGCPAAALPSSNSHYWEAKQSRNATRDRRNVRALRKAGWKVLVIWECDLKKVKRVQHRLQRFLEEQT